MSKPMTSDLPNLKNLLTAPVADLSEEQIQGLFLSAAKEDSQWFVGLEIELLGFHRQGLQPLEYAAVGRVLSALQAKRSMKAERGVDGELIGLQGDGSAISLEPGGQLEFASAPHRSLQALRLELETYTKDLRKIGDDLGLGFWACGSRPFTNVEDAPKMPKDRYDRMRTYFGERGARAMQMMHITGSIQCTVDFQDEQNLVNKVRSAARISPFIAALCASSPFSGGSPNGYHTLRYQIWRETDEYRCGIWPEMLDEEGLTVGRYLKRAMEASPVFMIRDGRHLPVDAIPFRELAQKGYEGSAVTVSDLLDHLTTFFPEIRPKGYVELRGMDALPPKYAVAVAGFWRGILDDEDARSAADDRLKTLTFDQLRVLQRDVALHGLDAESPIGPVADIAHWLVKVSYDRLRGGAPDCAECLEPLLKRAESKRSLAHDMLDVASREGVQKAMELCLI